MPDPVLCSVYIRDRAGASYGTNVSASGSHEAARKAVAFFLDPFWKGPKPTPETVLRVIPMRGQQVHVRVGSLPPDGRNV